MRRHRFEILLILAPWLTGCTGIFYQPSRYVLAPPPDNAENVELHSADGTLLRGWLLHAQDGPPKATFVHFHGNGGNITGHVRQLAWVTRHSYDLFEFDYRGYGGSEGVPSPKGVHEDAVAAMQYAARVLGPRSHTNLVFYGQSLGGAVMLRALADAGPERIDAVVVESSFHSYQEVAASALFRTPLLLPFTGLAYATVSDEYAPARYVATVSPIPLLVIHGDDDGIVDVRFGRILYALARPPKELWIIPGGHHVDAMRTAGAIYRERLLRFVEAAQAGSRG
jgi:fermentation-respiration switch protein FrsA (DUF1100 family)